MAIDVGVSDEPMGTPVVYLVACRAPTMTYVKIGRTRSLRRRLFAIQTGCPHEINHVLVILSKYELEVMGLESRLHRLLRPNRLRGEWYEGTDSFFWGLGQALGLINQGCSYDEIEELADVVGELELEIILHRHEFQFRQVVLPLRPSKPILFASVEVQATQIADILACPPGQCSKATRTARLRATTRRGR